MVINTAMDIPKDIIMVTVMAMVKTKKIIINQVLINYSVGLEKRTPKIDLT